MRIRSFAIAVIVTVCLAAPVVELFDQWDRTAQDGNDTELSAVIVALCAGIGLSVASVSTAGLWAPSWSRALHLAVARSVWFALPSLSIPSPNSRPPTALRV
jgi:hypothetical protein